MAVQKVDRERAALGFSKSRPRPSTTTPWPGRMLKLRRHATIPSPSIRAYGLHNLRAVGGAPEEVRTARARSTILHVLGTHLPAALF